MMDDFTYAVPAVVPPPGAAPEPTPLALLPLRLLGLARILQTPSSCSSNGIAVNTPAIRLWAIRLSTAVLLLGAIFAPASSGATVLIDLNALPQFQPTPKILLNNPPPTVDPVMTEELMARLIKHTRAVPETRSIFAELCVIFELCDGTKVMPMKMAMARSDVTDDDHYFTLPLEADSKDILILVDHPDVLYAYLTDKTGKLRAAAIDDQAGIRLITNEKAAVKFKAELALFAKEAADLPPTGTAAGNY